MNLLNIEEIEGVYGGNFPKIINNHLILTANGTAGSQYVVVPVKNLDINESYKFVFKAKKNVLGTSGQPYIRVLVYASNDDTSYSSIKNIQNASPTQGTEYFFNETLTGYKYYKFYFYNNTYTPVTIGEQTEYYDIKLQKGTVATPYSPYNQGTVTIKQRGKNLWNNSNVTSTTIMTPNSNGGFKIQKVGNERISEEYSINIPANTNIAISSILKDYTTSNGAIYCQWIATDNTTIWTPNIYEGTTTTSFNKDIKGIIFYLQQTVNDGDYVEIEKLQIEKGSTATTYEPYNANDYTIQTEPLRSLPNGVKDTIEADGIHRRVGRVVLDGSESWTEGGTQYTGLYSAYVNKDDMKKQEGYSGDLLSNYFKENDFLTQEEGITKSASPTTFALVLIRLSNDKATNMTTFKSWLSNNPTEVLYELATEVIEPLTQNQATTMLDIIKTGSYEGTTNIYTDEDVMPTMVVNYYKKG